MMLDVFERLEINVEAYMYRGDELMNDIISDHGGSPMSFSSSYDDFEEMKE